MIALLLLLFLLFPILIWVFIPVGFTLHSLFTLYRMPGQFLQVARDRHRRRNHALEHATVNVLEERAGRSLRVGGFAEQDGFLLQGIADPDTILAAAREGLRRLQAGEHRLALHPRCGTTIVAAEAIAALTFLLIVLLAPRMFYLGIAAAMLLAIWLARPVSLFLQRTLTTSTDVRGMRIEAIERGTSSSPLIVVLGAGGYGEYKVRTSLTGKDGTGRDTSAPRRRWRAY